MSRDLPQTKSVGGVQKADLQGEGTGERDLHQHGALGELRAEGADRMKGD